MCTHSVYTSMHRRHCAVVALAAAVCLSFPLFLSGSSPSPASPLASRAAQQLAAVPGGPVGENPPSLTLDANTFPSPWRRVNSQDLRNPVLAAAYLEGYVFLCGFLCGFWSVCWILSECFRGSVCGCAVLCSATMRCYLCVVCVCFEALLDTAAVAALHLPGLRMPAFPFAACF